MATKITNLRGAKGDPGDPAIANIAEVINKIYPVGALYLTMNSDDPNVLFGGSWERVESDRVLMAAGSVYPQGSTGGSSSIMLTAAQVPLPSHAHSTPAATSGAYSGTHTHTVALKTASDSGGSGYGLTNDGSIGFQGLALLAGTGGTSSLTTSATAVSHTHSIPAGTTGSASLPASSPVPILPPFIAVNIWWRYA